MRSGNKVIYTNCGKVAFVGFRTVLATLSKPSSPLVSHCGRSGCKGMRLLTRISTCFEHSIGQGGNASVIWRQRSLKVFLFCHLKLNAMKSLSVDSSEKPNNTMSNKLSLTFTLSSILDFTTINMPDFVTYFVLVTLNPAGKVQTRALELPLNLRIVWRVKTVLQGGQRC